MQRFLLKIRKRYRYLFSGLAVCLLVSPICAFAQQLASPCTADEAYTAFDFWIGEWIVETADGNKAGENSITREVSGCMLQERWTSARGSSGQSINYYDPSDGLWHQVWTDVAGNIGYFEGGLENGSMVLKGRWVNPDGSSYLLNGTWSQLEDGRVRQHFEQSTDDGKTWSTWFDGYYRKK
ncbi:MAG: hypothetical protein AAF564_06435 [Bacteroidota bacterium]